MRELKFLHCADIHLDAPFTSLGIAPKLSSIRRQDLKETFGELIDIALRECVDVLLISGDLYEHTYVRKSTIDHINHLFNKIPNIHIFIVPGNHDPDVLGSYYRHYAWNDHVHILTRDQSRYHIEALNTMVYGVGFTGFTQEEQAMPSIQDLSKGAFHILMTHGTVDMNFTNTAYHPLSSAVLSSLGMDYIALGHFHHRMDDIAGHGVLYNPGSLEPLGFDEEGNHGFYIGKLRCDEEDNKVTEIRFIKQNKRAYFNLEITLTGCITDEQVKDRISSLFPPDCSHDLFSIILKGYLAPEFKVDLQYLTTSFKDTCFFLKLIDQTECDYNFNELQKEPGLRGLFTQKMLAQIEKATSAKDRKIQIQALYYGLEALSQEKLNIAGGNYDY